MCYLVRQQQASAESVVPPLPTGHPPGRRWVGAGALVVAGLALAAYILPSANPPAAAVAAEPAAAAAVPAAEPIASGLQQVGTTGGAERAGLPLDDDVPSAPLASKAGYGGCHHGL